MAALRRFISEELPACDEPLAEAVPRVSAPKLPRGLESSGARYLFGLPVSAGIGQGEGCCAGAHRAYGGFRGGGHNRIARPEHDRLERGLAGVRARVEAIAVPQSFRRGSGDSQSAPGDSGRRDAAPRDRRAHRSRRLRGAGDRGSGRALQRAPAARGKRLHSRARGGRAGTVHANCSRRSMARIFNLPRWNCARLRSSRPKHWRRISYWRSTAAGCEGIVLESAGATSHAVILARSMGIPAVVGVADATRLLTARRGNHCRRRPRLSYSLQCAAPVMRFYRPRARGRRAPPAPRLRRSPRRPAITADGQRIEIGANISSAAEAAAAFAAAPMASAFPHRTALRAAQHAPPSEDEQFAVYAEAVRAADGRPVILRTADIGGDKPLPYLEAARGAQSVSGLSRRAHLSGISRVDRRANPRGPARVGGSARYG